LTKILILKSIISPTNLFRSMKTFATRRLVYKKHLMSGRNFHSLLWSNMKECYILLLQSKQIC